MWSFSYPKKTRPKTTANKITVTIVPTAAVELSKKLSGMTLFILTQS